MTELESSPNQLELVERGRDMARNIQGNLARRLYRSKDATELQDASDLLWGLANTLADYSEAADYWRRMYEETVRERTSERTCQDAGTRFNAWVCSECKATLLLLFDDCGEPTYSVDGVADVPRYCPNCGAKVVER